MSYELIGILLLGVGQVYGFWMMSREMNMMSSEMNHTRRLLGALIVQESEKIQRLLHA